jgi:hypothetical protein
MLPRLEFYSRYLQFALLAIFTKSLCGQVIPQVRPWNGSGYDAVQNLGAMGIASDFGPRNYGTDDWHGGIDYNTTNNDGNGDYGDLLIATEAGIIHDINKLVRIDNIAAYPVIDNGDYRLLHLHQFYDGTSTVKSVNNGTVMLKYMEPVNLARWAIIFIIDGDTTALGQISGMVKLGSQQIPVTNIINVGDPIGVIGTSGNVGAHLHLNSIPDNKNIYDTNDGWNKNPLQFVGFEDPEYTLRLYSPTNTTQLNLVYPGTSRSPMAAEVRMDNEPLGGSYSTVMSVDKVLFEILTKSMTMFDTIRSDNKKGLISLGGRLDETQINHTRGTFGNWSVTGMNPRAYTNNPTPNPWDVWYYSDFESRVHKNDVLGSTNSHLDANCPSNLRYLDGRNEIKSTAINIINVRKDSIIQSVIFDNFKPFVEDVNVNIGNTNIYNENWTCQNNNCVSFSNNNLNTTLSCAELNNGMVLRVRMSEQMRSLTLSIPEFNITNRTWSYTNDSINFEFFVTNEEFRFTEGNIQFLFDGRDMNNNSLIIFPNITSCHQIPRRYNIGFSDPNSPSLTYGQDRIHKISLSCVQRKQKRSGTVISIEGCELSLSAVYDCNTGCIDLAISGGVSNTYTVEWQKKTSSGYQTLFGWPKNNLSGNNGQEDLCSSVTKGTYQVIVTDYLCGTASTTIDVDPCQCFEVEVSDFHNVSMCGGFDDTNPPPPPYDECDGSATITVTGSSTYSVQWSNGSSGLTVTGLCTGTYTVTVSNGACTKTASVDICCCEPATPGTPPFPMCPSAGSFTIDGDITSPSSGTTSDGAIDLSVDPAGSYKYKWSGPNGFKSSAQDIAGLKVGTYCVTVTNGCTEPASKCFTLIDCSSVTINIVGSVINTCKDYREGSITVAITGGSSPYKYKWSNGKKDAVISELAEGQYCVTVTDKNGCKGVKCYNVGLNLVSYIPSTKPCGRHVICNGNPIDFIHSPVVCGFFDNPNDCRIENCRCSLTGGVTASFLHNFRSLEYDEYNCQLWGECPEGGFQLAATGFHNQAYNVFFDENCNCFGCEDVRYCDFGSLGIIVNEVYAATLEIEQTESTKCKNKGDCLWSFTCDGKFTVTKCMPCAGGGGLTYTNKRIISVNFDEDKILLGNLYASLKKSGLISDSVKLLVPVLSSEDMTITNYRQLLVKKERLKVHILEFNDIPDTMVCNQNCDIVYTDRFENSQESTKIVKVFPNPFSDLIEIELFAKISGEYEVEIIDVTGRVVQLNKLEILAGLNSYKVLTPNLKNGAYIVRVIDTDGSSHNIYMVHFSTN